MTSADPNHQKLAQLRKLLIQHFSLDELRVLCFDLGLEYEDLPGDTRTTKMHGLIEYLQRRSELYRLLAEVRTQRPDVIWPTFDNHKSPSATNKNYFEPKTGLEMIHIPGGEFLYGEEKRLAYLPDYWIAKTPVTNAHYLRFVQITGHPPPEHWKGRYPPADLAQHPVVKVSWHDASAFAEWLGMRLPSEEEWGKAAGGIDGRKYPWGDEIKAEYFNWEAENKGTTPVGTYSPQGDSPYGCVDMVGNVFEWTSSILGLQWVLCGSLQENDKLFRHAETLYLYDFIASGGNSDDFTNDFIGFRVVSLVGSRS